MNYGIACGRRSSSIGFFPGVKLPMVNHRICRVLFLHEKWSRERTITGMVEWRHVSDRIVVLRAYCETRSGYGNSGNLSSKQHNLWWSSARKIMQILCFAFSFRPQTISSDSSSSSKYSVTSSDDSVLSSSSQGLCTLSLKTSSFVEKICR